MGARMTREAAFSALFAAVSSAYPWGLASRRMKLWSEVPAALRPAFFQLESGPQTSHGELWVKSVFSRACVKLRGLFRYPRSEPDCMTRPVSEHDQPHIRSPLEKAVPTSRLRRAGAQGTKPFYQSACRAMVTIGSSTRIRQN